MSKLSRERYTLPEIAYEWGVSVPDIVDRGRSGKLSLYAYAKCSGSITQDQESETYARSEPVRGMVKLDPTDLEEALHKGQVDISKGQLEDGRWVEFQQAQTVYFGAIEVTQKEADRFARKYKLGRFKDDVQNEPGKARSPDKLGSKERDTLMKMIGLLAYMFAKGRGQEFTKESGEPNASQIAEVACGYVGAGDFNEHGLSKSNIQHRISDGAKLLNKF